MTVDPVPLPSEELVVIAVEEGTRAVYRYFTEKPRVYRNPGDHRDQYNRENPNVPLPSGAFRAFCELFHELGVVGREVLAYQHSTQVLFGSRKAA